MKSNKIKAMTIGITCAGIIMILPTISNASMIIKSGERAKAYMPATDCFAYCYSLRNSSSTLGNNNLDPHLTLNRDWAAVAYLSASVYGCNMNSTSLSTGTTNGNNSGVMEFGKDTENSDITGALSSSLLNTYSVESTVTIDNIVKFKNTKYVEILPTETQYTIGQGIIETNGWSTYYVYPSSTYPLLGRAGIFGIGNIDSIRWIYVGSTYSSGSSGGKTMFGKMATRPVIWN